MTPRETIRATLEFKQTDSVPYQLYPLDWWPELASRLDRHFGSPSWRKRIVTYMFGVHNVGDHGTVSLGNGLWRSPWGYTYHATLCHLELPALLKPDLDGYVWPEPESLGDWEGLARSYASQPDAFRLSGMSFGFFERGMRFRGMENLLMNIYELKRRTHGKMMLIGGMGVQRMMPFGDPEAVRTETRRLIRDMGAGGGYVIAPAKPLRDPIRTENAAAFIETILDQGRSSSRFGAPEQHSARTPDVLPSAGFQG